MLLLANKNDVSFGAIPAAKYGGVAIVSSGITFMAAPYFDFQKENRTELTAKINKMHDTSVSFNDVIQAYVNKANTGHAVDKKTEDQLQASIGMLFEEAHAIAHQYPEIREDSERYINSIVLLHATMENLKGPNDGGKEFIEALSDYLYEHDRFDERVASLKRGFLHSIIAGLNS